MPLKETSVAPVKLLPLTVTSVPTEPVVGENELMVGGEGGGVTVKSEALAPVPAEFVTLIRPVVAPLGTSTRSWVSESMAKLDELVPLKETSVVALKLLPCSVTSEPTTPLDGFNEEITGTGFVIKSITNWAACPPSSSFVSYLTRSEDAFVRAKL